MNTDNDTLGTRMKEYEATGENYLFTTIPIIARLDGKCFHSFTHSLARPYDKRLTDLMVATTKYLVHMSNARIGYTQSDEITLVFLSDRYYSELFMGGRSFKMISLLAASATAFFNTFLEQYLPEKAGATPLFDCRVWNVPSKKEAVNCLVWREKDATRNSIQMAGQSQFSHNQLMNKSCNEIQEMLFQEKQINWNNYPNYFKRGTYVQRTLVKTPFTAEEIASLPEKHNARKNPELIVERHVVKEVDMPIMTHIENREEVVFDGATPILRTMPQ